MPRLTTQHPGRVGYVLSIPQGRTAHQASDGKYYKRFNFIAVPMQDHEIRDVMNRSRHPLVEPVFTFREVRGDHPTLLLRIVLRNVGAMRPRDIKLVVLIPHRLFSTDLSMHFGQGSREIDGEIYDSFEIQKTDLVIFPDDEFPLTDAYGPLTLAKGVIPIDILTSSLHDLRWKIYADDMPPREGRILLKQIRS